jgi:restriction system protein
MPDPPALPRYQDLLWPTLVALDRLGGSGTVQEIHAQLREIGGYTDEQLNALHGQGPNSEIDYRAHWARTYLRIVGALENSSRGVWSLTEAGRALRQEDTAGIPARVRVIQRQGARPRAKAGENDTVVGVDGVEDSSWQEQLIDTLLALSPAAFEQLAKRLLRERGFSSVDVIGGSGDGGLDVVGVLRMNLLTFQMFVQCKRYRGSVSASAIRDFRGAMAGRGDKGVLITTGRFTADAVKEANRVMPPIDLVDGEQLCQMLKELSLGVRTQLVEKMTVEEDWFRALEGLRR